MTTEAVRPRWGCPFSTGRAAPTNRHCATRAGAGALALKLIFTAVRLGTGFPGGEVTPLFVIGVTLGRLLGVPIPLLAAIGFVAVFAGAANTPLTCTVLGVELFGGAGVVLFGAACGMSYIFSSHRGICESQRVRVPKGPSLPDPAA